MPATPDLAALELRALLDAASTSPSPGAGSLAAVAVAMGAALTAKTARLSHETTPQSEELAARAERLRDRALDLAGLDADSFDAALAALAADPRDMPEGRDDLIGAALHAAAAMPLLIAELAPVVASLAAEVTETAHPRFRADAAAGATLAAAGAEVARHLVEINLTVTPEDDRLLRAASAAADARRAAARAMRGG